MEGVLTSSMTDNYWRMGHEERLGKREGSEGLRDGEYVCGCAHAWMWGRGAERDRVTYIYSCNALLN